jgi:prepilin-type N-terminal cleavage/methylation domain-containing protein
MLEIKTEKSQTNKGFSLVELIIAMTVMLVALGLVSTLFSAAISTRKRESQRTDALTSAQAALNVMSREIANSGYGISISGQTNNGIVTADSTNKILHFRANLVNNDLYTNSPGEDLTYFYDSATKSIVRYDPNDSPQTSVIVNKISDVTFTYFSYTGSSSTATQTSVPTTDTGRVRINVSVQMDPVQGQPNNQSVSFTSDVTLRNSNYMLNQY